MRHSNFRVPAACCLLAWIAPCTMAGEYSLGVLQSLLRPAVLDAQEIEDRLRPNPFLGSPFQAPGTPSTYSESPSTTTRQVQRLGEPAQQSIPRTTPDVTAPARHNAVHSVGAACCPQDGPIGCDCDDGAVSVFGWTSIGYHSASNDLFNDRPHDVALHQGWLALEKQASTMAPLGFRVDLMYGIDADNTQAFGNPRGQWDFDNGFDHGSYGWAIPQAYLETAVADWKLKVGHFYTLVGYEVVPAPGNFFYSHAMTMVNSEPFTHTGVLASRSFGELEYFAGWTLGWDTGYAQLASGSAWLGGLRVPLGDEATLSWMATSGNLGWRGRDAYTQSLVLEAELTSNCSWVLQSDLVRVGSTGEDNVGINQYLFYAVSNRLSLGARLEWWKGDVLTGYAPHDAKLPASGSLSYYATTLGCNIKPHAQWTVRPEVRSDWAPAADYAKTYFAVDAVLQF